ncbi:hypothetical protein [Sorangium sp. So ce363]|uniref:hypothetical protein n=1 Tax=Sorangium sp. So ce363 TaxID=3133304 RepID=UPI003F5F19A3
MPTIKQYVNLPAAATGVNGPVRQLRVTPNQVPNVAPGDRVDWWIEPDPGNENLAFQSLTERTRLAHGAAPGVTVGAGHHFDNTLTFTHIGGDKYTIKASRDGQRAQFLATDEFQTWRKLYYTVWYSGAQTLATYNNIDPRFVGEFARHFIELERRAVLPALATVDSARVDFQSLSQQAVSSPTFDWPFMNGGPNALLNLRVGGVPPGGGTLTDKPLHMAFLLVPNCYYTQLERRAFPTANNAVGSITTFRTVWRDPTNGNNFMWTAQASWPAAGATDVRAYFTFTPGSPNRVNWNLTTLPGLTAHLATPGNTYNLTFSFIWKSSINGYSWGNFCVVGCTGPGRSETAVLGTFVHEMGHGIGQTVRQEPQYSATGVALATQLANPRWYTDQFGGQGPHCNTNAGLTPDPSTTSGQRYDWWPALGGRLCTIYHAGHNNRDDGVFCPVCAPRIRRVRLDTPAQTSRNWNHFG